MKFVLLLSVVLIFSEYASEAHHVQKMEVTYNVETQRHCNASWQCLVSNPPGILVDSYSTTSFDCIDGHCIYRYSYQKTQSKEKEALLSDPVIYRLDDGPRYQYLPTPDGQPRLQDTWLKVSDLNAMKSYRPDEMNIHYLYTRRNPSIRQRIYPGDLRRLRSTNYDSKRRTIVIIHGWTNSADSPLNTMLVPAFLAAEDVNVIVVDWSYGASAGFYPVAAYNVVRSGESVARFINWLNSVTGATPASYHIVGHSLGGHQAGVVGRNVNGSIAYITALDPASVGWYSVFYGDRFHADDGDYTEVIHTGGFGAGYILRLGQVDFYPNGGIFMPGCDDFWCNHARSYHYLAESLRSGGFTGRECWGTTTAIIGICYGPEKLQMGGVTPKTGKSGVFYLETNAVPPYSKG